MTPIRSAPASEQEPGDARRRIAEQGAVVAGEGERSHHGQVADLARGADRLADLGQVAEGFDDQQVSASLRQGRDLLGKGLAGTLGLHAAERRQAHAQRADIASHQHVLACIQHDLAGELYPGAVDLGYLSVQPVCSQLVAVGAEGVGLDDLRAGINIRPVDLGDQVRLRQVQLVEAACKPDAAGVEHGAHRPVAEQRGGGRLQQAEEA